MYPMGCMASSQRVDVSRTQAVSLQDTHKGETVVAAIVRLDDEIAKSEKPHPVARLAVVTAEMESIQQEINTFEETTTPIITQETYAKTIHQLFVSLDLYRRPLLASENEDFVANVNRKEMRRLELCWLQTRQTELQNERRILHAQILRTRSLYAQLQQLLETIWGTNTRPGTPLESELTQARGLRDALASVSARLRAAAEYAHAAVKLLDDALPQWKMTTVGKSGWERTSACADACRLLVQARCLERGARRVLAAPAAPRAARTLRLALDYAFTDALHDHKYQRATEIFMQFKEALVQLIDSIHKKRCKSQQELIEVFVNGKPVTVPKYYNIIQVLRQEKVLIPSFCYHERLSISGNCRMCLVEIEGVMKLQIACASPINKGMKIRTNSEMVMRAQESVLEFLLVNHPLDCPICDQGGECDLQDLTMKFGNDRSRFTDVHFQGKRASEDKNLGPLIRTEMTRCIHCTRCIRFGAQVCGLDILGTAGRGEEMLVGTYVDKMFLSELSGNIIDLCPVGSLTAIPYMFKARPWEITRTNSIDVTDATGTNIEISYRFDRVLRVLPRENEELNQEWVSDKGRWAIDSLEMQRLVSPMIRCNGCLCGTTWHNALKQAANLICTSGSVMAIAGPHANVETLVTAKDFVNMLGYEHTYVERGLNYGLSGVDIRAAYSLNNNMKDIQYADKILLVGTNPRFEAPTLNARIRQAYMFNEADIYVIGPKCEYNYHVTYLGEDLGAMSKAKSVIESGKKPMIFVGISQLETEDAPTIMNELLKIPKPIALKGVEWNMVNILTREASFAGALEAGWKPGALDAVIKCPPKVLILLGADELLYEWTPPQDISIIYIGFQGDLGAEKASIVLPGSAYTEAGGLYLNMEGRGQYAYPAVTPPGDARLDWKIIRALAEYCGMCMSYDDHYSLCQRLAQISPNFVELGKYQPKAFAYLLPQLVRPPNAKGPSTKLDVDMKLLTEYYCSDVFTYNSPTMIQAQKAACAHTKSPYAAI